MNTNKTIYALSTLAGKSGVALFRVSGGDALKVCADLTLGKVSSPVDRKAVYSSIYCPFSKEVIDNVLLTYFKGPNSFTGEDTLEICTHGSIAVIKKLLRVFSDISYINSAEPGEFSRRSFLNAKMDLTQAEGLSNLIEAETEIQQKAAMMQMEGKLSNIYGGWRSELIAILASVEAFIDFPAEDLPEAELKKAQDQINRLRDKISRHLKTYLTNEVISKGFQISIVGSPNAGKSSLLNYLSNSDVAIVSDISGTTRDVVSVKMDLKGYSVMFNDTAGLREETEDEIEIEGIKRSYKAIEGSNLVLFVVDAKNFVEKKQIELIESVAQINKNVIVVYNKVDDERDVGDLIQTKLVRIAISTKMDYNCDELMKLITKYIEDKYALGVEPIISSARTYEYLKQGVVSLEEVDFDYPLEMVSEHLRGACDSISKAVGDITLEDILDQVFGAFCIGK